jgi:hypothetical protein
LLSDMPLRSTGLYVLFRSVILSDYLLISYWKTSANILKANNWSVRFLCRLHKEHLWSGLEWCSALTDRLSRTLCKRVSWMGYSRLQIAGHETHASRNQSASWLSLHVEALSGVAHFLLSSPSGATDRIVPLLHLHHDQSQL